MEYYFVNETQVNHTLNQIIIQNEEYKHLAKVLRKRAGDSLVLTDGNLNVYFCKIKVVTSEIILCEITDKKFNLNEPEVNVKLYVAPLRNLSRFEFALEKSVELGIKSVHPVITENTVLKNKFSHAKTERFNKIIKAAMSQSQRCYLPVFNNTISFSELIAQTKNDFNKIVMYEFSDDNSETHFEKNSNDISLLIGPEGGFTKNEMNMLADNGWKHKSLGERKLRAETASLISVYKIISDFNFNNLK